MALEYSRLVPEMLLSGIVGRLEVGDLKSRDAGVRGVVSYSLPRLLGLRLGSLRKLPLLCARRFGIWFLVLGDILFCGRGSGVGCREP